MSPLPFRCLTCLAILFILSPLSQVAVFGQEARDPRSEAYEISLRQEEARRDARRIGDELLFAIEEMVVNQLDPDTLSDVRFLAQRLASLGLEDMAALVDQLNAAASSPNPEAATAALFDVYREQLRIESDLRAIARTIAIRRLFEDLNRQVNSLLQRQLKNWRLTGELQNASHGSRSLLLIVGEQQSIGDDIQTFFQSGESLASRFTENLNQRAANTTASFTRNVNGATLKRLATEANSQLADANLAAAARTQARIVAELRRIHQIILSMQPSSQRLADALNRSAELAQAQAQLDAAAASEGLNQAQKDQQKALADEAALLASQIADLSPEANAALEQARAAMAEQAEAQASSDASRPQGANPPPPTPSPESAPPTEANQASPSETAAAASPPPPASDPQASGASEPDSATPPPSPASEALQTAQAALSDALEQATQAEIASAEATASALSEAAEAATRAESALGQNQTGSETSTGNQPAASDPQTEIEAALAATEQAAGQEAAQRTDARAALSEAKAALEKAGQAVRDNQTQAAQESLQEARAQLTAAQNAIGRSPANQASSTGELVDSESRASADEQQGTRDSFGSSDSGLIGGSGEGDGLVVQTELVLSDADRAAFESLRTESYPEEFAPWIYAYRKKLAED
ncbi:MAG: hypothetical protein ACFCU4_05035 [Puniceicoccaceae bacterium]